MKDIPYFNLGISYSWLLILFPSKIFVLDLPSQMTSMYMLPSVKFSACKFVANQVVDLFTTLIVPKQAWSKMKHIMFGYVACNCVNAFMLIMFPFVLSKNSSNTT